MGDPEPSFSGFFGACAPLDVELKRRKDSGEIKGNPSALDLIALLEEDEQLKVLPAAGSTVQSLASATETSDAVGTSYSISLARALSLSLSLSLSPFYCFRNSRTLLHSWTSACVFCFFNASA